MAATTIVPLEEYLRTSYDPDVEYVDGALVERNGGECRHSRLQFLIGLELGPREPGRVHTYTEQRVRVSPQPKYRVPDLCLMALPYQREPVFTHPPHLIVEILSSDDEPADMLEKVADYLKFGVPHIWIPDPYRQRLQVADRDGLHDRPELVVETELAGRLDFGELFARLDEPSE
ncbi:MAG TPA: Uma2 family endonuclease [Bryobacteraceae bacterium]|nr:Uma2 family endonuclease [Bryobacteraceae bacterium]